MKFIELTKVQSRQKIAILISGVNKLEVDTIPSHHRTVDCTKVHYGDKLWVKVEEPFSEILRIVEYEK